MSGYFTTEKRLLHVFHSNIVFDAIYRIKWLNVNHYGVYVIAKISPKTMTLKVFNFNIFPFCAR